MKKFISLLLVAVMILGCVPVAFAAEEGDVTRTPTYTFKQYAGKVGQWGPYANSGGSDYAPKYEKVTGIDGTAEAAIHITGGINEGGYLFSLNDGGFLANKGHGPNNAYKGAIDASEFFVTYKSKNSFRLQFESEWRTGNTRKYSSREVYFAGTNGETVTVTLPLSDFERDEGSKWVYNMFGQYTTNFAPVVTLNVHGISSDSDVVFEEFGFNWYAEDMVSGLVIEDYKKEYFQGYDAFDYTQGKIGIKRGGSSEVSEWITLDDPRVEISGYNNANLNNNLKLTATVLNKTLDFNVAIVEYKPNDIKSIEVRSPKTSYYIDEAFDYTGSVVATFNDGSTETVALNDSNVTISGFDSSAPKASQTITVEYGGLETTYNVVIKDFIAEGNITVKNPKRLYQVGDKFDWHTGTIVADGGVPEGALFSKYATVSGFDSSAPAQDQEITVTYGGKTTTYTVDIIEDKVPIKYKLYADLSRQSTWKWGNNMYTLGPVEGAAQDGEGYAIVIEGDGTHGGGGCLVFTDGNCGGGRVTMDDGTVLDGLKGADAMGISYINTFTRSRASNYPQYSPSFNFKIEYQNGTGTSKDSGGYVLPVTKTDVDDPDDTGYWVRDYLIDFREHYDPTDKSLETAESIDWLYNNMKSAYINGSYAPSVQWRLYGKLLDGDYMAIDELYFAWYEDEPVEKLELIKAKKNYQLDQEYDMTGTVKIYYKNGTTREVTADYMDISGFDSSVTGTQTVTLSYAGKTTSYDVNIGETPEPEVPEISADVVYEESFETNGKAIVEVSLDEGNGDKIIKVGEDELFYSIQREIYVGIIDASKLGENNALADVSVTDGEPTIFVYGNVDGDYEYDDIIDAIDSSDLAILKAFIKGSRTLIGANLIASDLDGDGLSDSSDLISLKNYIKNGKEFGILK